MSPAPALDSFAEDLYGHITPVTYGDEAARWLLAYVCAAIGSMFQEIEDVASDSDTHVGWAKVLDVDAAPEKWLPWLAQSIGVRLAAGLADAGKREQIRNPAGFKRGTPGAIRAAPTPYLTGTKQVTLYERYQGNAYRLKVTTRISETADEVAVEAAIRSQKPAGIVLTYDTVPGQDYITLRSAQATYTAMRTAYATYEAARAA